LKKLSIFTANMLSLTFFLSLALGVVVPQTDLAQWWSKSPLPFPWHLKPGRGGPLIGNNPTRKQGDLSYLVEIYESGNATLLNEMLLPFALMSSVMYTDTHDMQDPGLYKELMTKLNSRGFTRVEEMTADPPLGKPGVKINTFENTDLKLTVVAYRGTNMTNPADLCADNFLGFGNSASVDCSGYTDSQVDYYAQGLRWLRENAPKIPHDHEIMITGHSLGAGLGALIGLTTNLSTIVIASPPYGGFATKMGLSWETADPSKLVIIADQWDPVYNMASDNSFYAKGWKPGNMNPTLAQDRSGTECVYASDVTTACLATFAFGQEYLQCFKDKHYNFDLAHWNYFDHLSSNEMPLCTILSKSK